MGTPQAGISRTIVAAVFDELALMGYPGGLRLLESKAPLVSGRDADSIFDEAATALGDPALALAVVQRLAVGSLGELDYALCTSDSLRVGLDRLARFYRVGTERVTLDLEQDARRATLVFRSTSDEPYSRHWRELPVALIARRIRQTVGREVGFQEVAFAHAPPPDSEPYTAFFGVPVRFGSDADRLGFATTLLSEPLRTAMTALGDLLEAKMREAAPPGTASDAFLGRVRRALSAQIDAGDLTIAATAKRLATSTRTLQRELARAATSHKALLDELRRERALALLAAARIPLVDISARLGFSDPRAFFRAFRRWTGTTPAAVRRRRSR